MNAAPFIWRQFECWCWCICNIRNIITRLIRNALIFLILAYNQEYIKTRHFGSHHWLAQCNLVKPQIKLQGWMSFPGWWPMWDLYFLSPPPSYYLDYCWRSCFSITALTFACVPSRWCVWVLEMSQPFLSFSIGPTTKVTTSIYSRRRGSFNRALLKSSFEKKERIVLFHGGLRSIWLFSLACQRCDRLRRLLCDSLRTSS